jgi:hypothetical protein
MFDASDMKAAYRPSWLNAGAPLCGVPDSALPCRPVFETVTRLIAPVRWSRTNPSAAWLVSPDVGGSVRVARHQVGRRRLE